jgi:hypothetical protein
MSWNLWHKLFHRTAQPARAFPLTRRKTARSVRPQVTALEERTMLDASMPVIDAGGNMIINHSADSYDIDILYDHGAGGGIAQVT